MKKSALLLFAALLALPLPAASASHSRRIEYQQKIDKELQDFSLRINELKVRAEQLTAETRIELEQRIRLLESKQRGTQHKLARLKKTPGGQWDKTKKSVDQAIVDLRKTYTKTLNKLR